MEKHDQLYPLLQALRSMGVPLPQVLKQSAELANNARMRIALETEEIDLAQLKGLVDEMREFDYTYEMLPIELAASRRVSLLLDRLLDQGENIDLLQTANGLLEILAGIPVNIDPGDPQNIYFRLCARCRERITMNPDRAGETELAWLEELRKLGRLLNVKCL
jgi:hypothetical protein